MWQQPQSCDSCTATFAVEIQAHLRQMTSTAWKNSGSTLLLQLQQWHPCVWQDQGGSQAKQIYHCMVPGVELQNLQRHANGYEMLNQQSEKRSFPNTTQNLIAFKKQGAISNFTFLRYTISIQDQSRRWHLVTSCPKVVFNFQAAAFAAETCAQRNQITTLLLQPRLRTRSIGKTRMVPKPSKFTTVWFLSLNLTDVPLDMKCQVKSEKSQISPNTKPTWFLLESWWLPTTLQLHFFALHNLDLGPIQTIASGNSCPKVVYTSQATAFAAETCAQKD